VFAVKSQVLENEDCQGNRDGRIHFAAIPFGVADASGFVLVGETDANPFDV